jgi:hypothetical protein
MWLPRPTTVPGKSGGDGTGPAGYRIPLGRASPTYPPNCTVPVLPAKLPMNRMISVISRVRNTPKTAMFTWADSSIMYVLKMANASRIQAMSCWAAAGLAAVGATNRAHRNRPIQKPP